MSELLEETRQALCNPEVELAPGQQRRRQSLLGALDAGCSLPDIMRPVIIVIGEQRRSRGGLHTWGRGALCC